MIQQEDLGKRIDRLEARLEKQDEKIDELRRDIKSNKILTIIFELCGISVAIGVLYSLFSR